MPFYLDEIDLLPEIEGAGSALIVPCRFCPAASFAVRSKEAYIDFPRKGLTTVPYERLIEKLVDRLQSNGIRTEVFRSPLVHQFVMCMWSASRRNKLGEAAGKFDAVVVLGCEAAVASVRETVKNTDCRVIGGMKNEGLMSIRPRYSLPCNITLELESVTPIRLAG